MLVSLPLVGQMVAVYCDTQAQSCGIIEESNCKKLEAIRLLPKEEKSQRLGDAGHWLLKKQMVRNISGLEADGETRKSGFIK